MLFALKDAQLNIRILRYIELLGSWVRGLEETRNYDPPLAIRYCQLQWSGISQI